MNRHERVAELQTLLNQPDFTGDEFALWQARVSAIIGFDREQQTAFRAMADNAPSSDPKTHAEYRRRLKTIILQAIADLEVNPDVLAEPPATPSKRGVLARLADALDLRPGAFGLRLDLKKLFRRKKPHEDA